MPSEDDRCHMRHALALARRALGRAAPNPAVGCVLVKNGIVVGRGWTGDGGRPHAETQALIEAGTQAQGATAYITLEPCAHQGKTPPCARAIADAGIARAVIACRDPDPRVDGKGIAILREAGLAVEEGIMEAEARSLVSGFILRVMKNRPLITLKTAVSADKKIAPAPGKRQWLTGERARRRAHLERSFHDAILVGIGTALADDPLLTTRLRGYGHRTTRIVLDTHMRLSPHSALVKSVSPRDPVLILHHAQSTLPEFFSKPGLEAARVNTRDVRAVLILLAERGVTRLLVEGGAKIHTAFLEAGITDRMLIFRAQGQEIGPAGVEALDGYALADLQKDFGLEMQEIHSLGQDLLEIYAKPA